VGQKGRRVTCSDCYFRKCSLCALDLAEPCPTFRPVLKGTMIAPPQARLVEPTVTARTPWPLGRVGAAAPA
jgi:hypothetical protein